MQGAQSPSRGGGVRAEGSCVQPVPFSTAPFFSCRSYRITPALRSDAATRSCACECAHTQTHSPHACSLHACSHVRQLSLVCRHHTPSAGGFASGCRGCRAWQGQSHTHPHSQRCHQPAQAASPRRGPLHAQRLRGCAHTRPRADLQHANCWEGEGKKNPTDSAERGGGGKREKERENDRLQSPLSA